MKGMQVILEVPPSPPSLFCTDRQHKNPVSSQGFPHIRIGNFDPETVLVSSVESSSWLDVDSKAQALAYGNVLYVPQVNLFVR